MSQGYDQHKTVADAEEAQGRLKLTQVLIRELEAARMLALAQPPAAILDAQETTGKCVLDLCETLALDPPTQGVLALCRAQAKVEGLMKDLPSAHLGAPLLPKLDLQPQQIEKLDQINQCFAQEYGTRREVLLKRLDVTLHALSCSPKHQGRELVDTLKAGKKALGNQTPLFGLYDILAARDDLTRLYPSSELAVQASIKRLLIGSVPDRGGRVDEKRQRTTMPVMRGRTAEGTGKGRGKAHRSRVQGGGWDESAAGEQHQRDQKGGRWGPRGGRGRGGRGGKA